MSDVQATCAQCGATRRRSADWCAICLTPVQSITRSASVAADPPPKARALPSPEEDEEEEGEATQGAVIQEPVASDRPEVLHTHALTKEPQSGADEAGTDQPASTRGSGRDKPADVSWSSWWQLQAETDAKVPPEVSTKAAVWSLIGAVFVIYVVVSSIFGGSEEAPVDARHPAACSDVYAKHLENASTYGYPARDRSDFIADCEAGHEEIQGILDSQD